MYLKNPLVSIIVITYNSSKYVLETLESAKAQTYQNIELIVSDDCSTDNTVEICRNWTNENKERFVRTEVITVECNSGIAPNCNRGYKAAKGEWVKAIAGDDILIENCISTNMDVALVNDYPFIFSKFQVLSSDEEKKRSIEKQYENNYHLFIGNQLDNLMNFGYYFPTITFFAKTSYLFKVGLLNEEYPFHEDLPMWFKILKSGYDFHFIEVSTVLYRVHGDSIYNNSNVVNPLWLKSTKKFYYKEFLKERIRRRQYLKTIDTIVNFWYYDISILFGNKHNTTNQFCKLIKFMSPLYIREKILQILGIKLNK